MIAFFARIEAPHASLASLPPAAKNEHISHKGSDPGVIEDPLCAGYLPVLYEGVQPHHGTSYVTRHSVHLE